MTHLVLASSPLVGATALAPLADVLRRRGYGVELPQTSADLAAHAQACSEVRRDAVLVAYSGAGPRAHVLAAAGGAAAIVYLDAHLPADGVAPDDDPRLRAFLDELPLDDDGRLPPWSDWWPTETLIGLVPDDARRRELASNCPRVPRAVMSTPVPAPPFGGTAGYVLLSEPYRSTAATVAGSGWPIAEIEHATHLSPFIEPEIVADALLSVVEQVA